MTVSPTVSKQLAKRGVIRCGEREINLFSRTHVMGVLNVTPDSFYDAGWYYDLRRAVSRALEMAAEGADFIDIGGLSTRPGSEPVSEEEELKRVVPVITEVAAQVSVPISIDTYRATVARAALEAGAALVNDISGLAFDPAMAKLVATSGSPVIIMHIKGTPRDMQVDPHYDDVVGEINQYFRERISGAKAAGIRDGQIILDPGIGFGKRPEDNLVILNQLRDFVNLGYPVLVGASRKSFVGKILNLPPEERLEGSLAAAAVAIQNGAAIIRTHDVKATVRVARVIDAICQSS